ncbi:MAG: helix-hairpin-helix domain-containing protein [Actinomycetota bacterium]
MRGEEDGGRHGLAQRLDEVLFRVETWRPPNRPAVAPMLAGLVIAVAAVGWWYGRPAPTSDVEALIPLATGDDDRTGERGEVTDPGGSLAAGLRSDTVPPESSGRSAAGGSGGPDDAEGADAAGGDPDGDGQQKPVHLVVHVVGAVIQPGLVSIPEGSRIADAVAAAGGPAPDAAVDRLNLAAPVADGMQVRIPAGEEQVDGPLVVLPPGVGGGAAGGSGGGAGAGQGSAVTAEPVNLNTASADALDTLPGVGPATAAAILRWREENGGFRSTEELLMVPGIGQAKLAAIRDLVTV